MSIEAPACSQYGFRIVGNCRNERRLIDWATAFRCYADCDDRANIESEAYLSAFTFGDEFCQHLEQTGSTRGYGGPCCADWMWWDIDRDNDIATATTDTRRLAAFIVDQYGLDDDDLLLFFSGRKGYHVGLPMSLFASNPSDVFHRVVRRCAESIAERSNVVIDAGIYDRVRAFRAPNSRHAKSGRYKVRVNYRELLHLVPEQIVRMAGTPKPFDIPEPAGRCEQAVTDWHDAIAHVEAATKARVENVRANGHTPSLNRLTRDFIRGGAQAGDRHRLLYSAARNLAEFGCSFELAHSLLSEPALDCGLRPSDVRRQIECGLDDARRQ